MNHRRQSQYIHQSAIGQSAAKGNFARLAPAFAASSTAMGAASIIGQNAPA